MVNTKLTKKIQTWLIVHFEDPQQCKEIFLRQHNQMVYIMASKWRM
jgi:hypothetical protein